MRHGQQQVFGRFLIEPHDLTKYDTLDLKGSPTYRAISWPMNLNMNSYCGSDGLGSFGMLADELLRYFEV